MVSLQIDAGKVLGNRELGVQGEALKHSIRLLFQNLHVKVIAKAKQL